ncbi:hypothetical protein M5D96_007060 [Drosophila gunungcola]|uniref:Uncharacterized protein n=1 Tax=Drosophila gunungcola TaxID=103775 RepID=A0A9P9YMA0_9MUSC|nr:hypothetical protein M5D96_007060 [Drosophila gunungcola]
MCLCLCYSICVPRHFKHAKSEFESQSKSEFEFSSPDSRRTVKKKNKKIKRKSINAKIPKETILMDDI